MVAQQQGRGGQSCHIREGDGDRLATSERTAVEDNHNRHAAFITSRPALSLCTIRLVYPQHPPTHRAAPRAAASITTDCAAPAAAATAAAAPTTAAAAAPIAAATAAA